MGSNLFICILSNVFLPTLILFIETIELQVTETIFEHIFLNISALKSPRMAEAQFCIVCPSKFGLPKSTAFPDYPSSLSTLGSTRDLMKTSMTGDVKCAEFH